MSSYQWLIVKYAQICYFMSYEASNVPSPQNLIYQGHSRSNVTLQLDCPNMSSYQCLIACAPYPYASTRYKVLNIHNLDFDRSMSFKKIKCCSWTPHIRLRINECLIASCYIIEFTSFPPYMLSLSRNFGSDILTLPGGFFFKIEKFLFWVRGKARTKNKF